MWIAAFFYICSWLQPLHLLPWVSWHSEFLAFFSLIFAGFIFLIRSFRQQSSALVEIPYVGIFVMVFILISVVQIIFGKIIFFGDWLVVSLYAFLCICASIIGYESIDKKKFSDSLFCFSVVIVISSVLSCFVALSQFFDVWEKFDLINRVDNIRRPGGNIGQSNHLATLLLMGMASLLLLYEIRKISFLTALIIAVLLSLTLVFTESRTGITGFFLFVVWWGVKKKIIESRLNSIFVFIFTACLLLIFFNFPKFFDFFYVFSGAASEINLTTSGRSVVWPQILNAVSMKPFLGWGIFQVPNAHNEVVDIYEESIPVSYSHNIILDLFIGIGIPLSIFFILSFVFWFFKNLRNVIDIYSWYCVAIVIVFFWHSMFEFPFAYAYFVIPVFFVMGKLERLCFKESFFKIKNTKAMCIYFLLSFFYIFTAIEYVEAEEDFRVARFEALRTGKTPDSYVRPNIYLLTQLDALLHAARIQPRPGMTKKEINLSKDVALRYPWSATQYRYALVLALNGDSSEARRQLKVIKTMHGAKIYQDIKENWIFVAQEKYPQINIVDLP